MVSSIMAASSRSLGSTERSWRRREEESGSRKRRWKLKISRPTTQNCKQARLGRGSSIGRHDWCACRAKQKRKEPALILKSASPQLFEWLNLKMGSLLRQHQTGQTPKASQSPSSYGVSRITTALQRIGRVKSSQANPGTHLVFRPLPAQEAIHVGPLNVLKVGIGIDQIELLASSRKQNTTQHRPGPPLATTRFALDISCHAHARHESAICNTGPLLPLGSAPS